MTTTIAIIGAGHMGTSLLGGLIANHYNPQQLWATDTDTEKLAQLQKQFQIHTTNNNIEAIHQAEVVILAVKPNIVSGVAKNMASAVQQKKPLIISVAAGIPEASIQYWLGGNIAIVRAMPNTPALIGCGATALFANSHVTSEQHSLAESILRAVGMTVWIQDEYLMHSITSLSGSGPAYFFLVIEALQNAAIDFGVPAETARLLTLQTAYGAARMALESEVDAAELRQRVASPGGTTERALNVLEEQHLRDIFKMALASAKQRSEEMAEILGKTTET